MHLVVTFSLLGSVFVVLVFCIAVVVSFLLFFLHRSKKRKRKMSILMTQQVKPMGGGSQRDSECEGEREGEEEGNPLIPAHPQNINGSTCTSRRSRVSLTSLVSSKFKVQEYTRRDGGGGGVERGRDNVGHHPRVSIVSESDSSCYDLEGNLPLVSSHESHMTRTASSRGSHMTSSPYNAASISPHLLPHPLSTGSLSKTPTPNSDKESDAIAERDVQGSLFPNWRSSVGGASRISPGGGGVQHQQMQRPMTMSGGGVYSTGHGHHHHLHRHSYGNRSHGNIGTHGGGSTSHRESVTSGYITGTSTRTSALTSRSISRQFASSTATMGSGSGDLGSSMQQVLVINRDSKTPAQSTRDQE